MTDTSVFAATLQNSAVSTPQSDFYRAVVQISTTSDWTRVSVASGAEVAALSSQVLTGSQQWFSTDLTEQLIGAVSKAHDTTNASMEVTVMFTSIQKDAPIIFKIDKGGAGVTAFRLYNYNTGDRKLIVSVKIAQSDDTVHAHFMLLHSEDLANGGPLNDPFQGPSHLVWAFYYPWWGNDGVSWNNPMLRDKPASGPYNSGDEATILAQIRMAKSAGIDGFIVSWDSSDTQSSILREILKVGAQENFKVTIYFESISARIRSQGLLQTFRTFFTGFSNDEGYFKLNGLPVIFVYAVDSQPVATWNDIFQTLRSEGHDAFYIAESDNANTDYLEAFDGIHIYGISTISQLEALNATYRHLQLSTRSFGFLHSGALSGKLWAATLMPGYDARLLQNNSYSFVPRDNGNTYRKTFDAAFASDPDWILITSFNEWLENTYIEPSLTYGSNYIDLTSQFSAAFKNTSES